MTTATTVFPLNTRRPCIHLNGTGKDALVKQQQDVYRALYATLQALAEATPHMRDYYPLGDEVYARALAEHQRRRAVLDALMADVQADVNDLFWRD